MLYILAEVYNVAEDPVASASLHLPHYTASYHIRQLSSQPILQELHSSPNNTFSIIKNDNNDSDVCMQN